MTRSLDLPALRSAWRRAWSRVPTLLRMLLLLLAVGLATRWLSGAVTRDATFSISARSEVLTLELGCDQHIVWDLPAGQVAGVGADAEPPVSEVVSVALRGGARARVRASQGQPWQLELDRSDSFGCGAPAADTIVVSAGDRALAPDAQGYVYRSARPVEDGERPTLLLRGRVVIGDEIPFGSGLRGAVAAAMLGQARIEVRTPDAQTAQRRLIHEEQVDAGGIIDSHGCLDTPADRLPACVRQARSQAEGFIHLGADGPAQGFDVQLLVNGEHVGVRQQAGAERRIVVTWWSRLVTSSWAQIAAAWLVGLSALAGLWPLLARAQATSAREEGSET